MPSHEKKQFQCGRDILCGVLGGLLFGATFLFQFLGVPAGSPSPGGNVAVYVSDINQLSLPTPCYSVLVYVSIFTALSAVFHSMNSPDNSLLSHSVLLVLFLPYWFFQLNI